MKKSAMICIAVVLALLVAPWAQAVSIGWTRLLGSIVPSQPASEENAVVQVNYLIQGYNAGNPSGKDLGDNISDPQDEHYYLLYTNPTLIPPVPLPLTATGAKTDTEDPNINLGAMTYQWILAKYGEDAEVYYIGDILGGPIELPSAGLSNGNGLSHYVLFEPGEYDVPDGGATVGLLGIAMLSLGLIRKRFR